MNRAALMVLFFLLSLLPAIGQESSVVFGFVKDSLDQPVSLANVTLLGTQVGTMTNEAGYFELNVPAEKSYTLVFSCVGYRSQQYALKLEANERKRWDAVMVTDINALQEVSVSVRQERASNFTRIDVESLNYVPSTGGKVEAVIKSQAGVSSNNELSSQYSVRGGNFDENLVYVNDMEIYRPFLVRSGQQEGLSFLNSDLVSSIKFSAGGFSSMYGDRMASALDITYKTPRTFGGSASLSLLGASAHLEGATPDQRLSFLAGYRYKTTSYLLNTLETKGDYKPQFSDFQTLVTYHFNKKISLSFLGNYSSNIYRFIPKERETEFGTKDIPLNLKIYYDGQEIDRFATYLGAFSLVIRPVKEMTLKFIASGFRTSEEETFDIQGQYLINELDNTIGSDTYGDSILNIGIGTMINHARNYLDAYVVSGSHIGSYSSGPHQLRWGLK
ncbi:MAG: carboxypeptidase-like regulatory domain-containing protein, partial [Bacteroidota bacterium]